jgi:uncharacterized protein (TIGR00369 family)
VGRVEVLWDDPADLAVAARLTGRELIEWILRGDLPAPSIGATMQFRVTGVGDGLVHLQAVPGHQHLNPVGTVHGGFAMTVLDTAMAMAIFTRLPAGVWPASIEIQTRFHRPLYPDTGSVEAEGRVLHVGSTTATAEADLRDGAGRLAAHATCTCAILALT